jgi:hypothetical protein
MCMHIHVLITLGVASSAVGGAIARYQAARCSHDMQLPYSYNMQSADTHLVQEQQSASRKQR